MTPAKARHHKKKENRSWTIPAILAFIVSVVGALSVVELRPQISVSPHPERATNQPFSAPFEITNTGYLGFHVDNVIVVFPTVEYQGLRVQNGMAGNIDWDDFDLNRGASKTIFPYFANGMPKNAEIVIAVDYSYFRVKFRWLFRFDGTHIDSWQWSKQPIKAADEPFLNDVVDKALKRHREANSRHS